MKASQTARSATALSFGDVDLRRLRARQPRRDMQLEPSLAWPARPLGAGLWLDPGRGLNRGSSLKGISPLGRVWPRVQQRRGLHVGGRVQAPVRSVGPMERSMRCSPRCELLPAAWRFPERAWVRCRTGVRPAREPFRWSARAPPRCSRLPGSGRRAGVLVATRYPPPK